jgi:hypothetical protein
MRFAYKEQRYVVLVQTLLGKSRREMTYASADKETLERGHKQLMTIPADLGLLWGLKAHQSAFGSATSSDGGQFYHHLQCTILFSTPIISTKPSLLVHIEEQG